MEINDSGLFEVKLKENNARVFLLFIQAAEAVLKYSESELNKDGLYLVKLMVLQILQASGGTLTPSEIAKLTHREKHDITTLVRRLEKSQLIEVKNSLTDKRSIKIILTDKGKRAIIDTRPAARNIVKQVMSSIPDSSIHVLEKSLKTLMQNACDGLKNGKM